jgi:hypothetical protein
MVLKSEEMPACGPVVSFFGMKHRHAYGVAKTSLGEIPYSATCIPGANMTQRECDDLVAKAIELNKHLLIDPICMKLGDRYFWDSFKDETGLVNKCYEAGSKLERVPAAVLKLDDFKFKTACLRAYSFGKYEVMKGYRPKAPRP